MYLATSAGWDGPEGFYARDFRAPLLPNESKTWGPFYLWANPDQYEYDVMDISFAADGTAPPPWDRTYTAKLLYVPPGIQGAPAVGTQWQLKAGDVLSIQVPTIKTFDGLEGYQFSFTVGAVPEPATLLGMVAGALGLLRRQR